MLSAMSQIMWQSVLVKLVTRVILITIAHWSQYLIAKLTKTVQPYKGVWMDTVWTYAKNYNHAVLVLCARFWTPSLWRHCHVFALLATVETLSLLVSQVCFSFFYCYVVVSLNIYRFCSLQAETYLKLKYFRYIYWFVFAVITSSGPQLWKVVKIYMTV